MLHCMPNERGWCVAWPGSRPYCEVKDMCAGFSTCLPDAGEPHSQAIPGVVAVQHRAALGLLADVEQPAVGGDAAASRQAGVAVAVVQVPCSRAPKCWNWGRTGKDDMGRENQGTVFRHPAAMHSMIGGWDSREGRGGGETERGRQHWFEPQHQRFSIRHSRHPCLSPMHGELRTL